MPTINDNSALLLYRVGPVLCCSPCLPIRSIIEPPSLTHPPGTSRSRPGIFKYANAIVSSLDLRYKFGVEQAHWAKPGRTIVTQLEMVHIGFYVDDILDVISMPTSGWGPLPAMLPRGIFTRTLLLNTRIYLYAEFDDLQRIADSGYLRQYIQQLLETAQPTSPTADARKQIPATNASRLNSPTQALAQKSVAVHAAPKPFQSATTKKPTTIAAQAKQVRQHTVGDNTVAASTKKSAPPSPARHGTARRSSKTTAPHKAPLLTRTTTTVSAQAMPVSLSAVAKPATPISTHTPPARRTASVPARPQHERATTTTTHYSLIGILMWILAFSGAGAGIWYVFRDDTMRSSKQTVRVSAGVRQTPPSLPSVTTPIEPQTSDTVHDSPTTLATNIPTPAPDPALTTPSSTHVTIDKPVTPVQPAIKTPPPATTASQGDYHARIEQDQHGLTITLDVPADDPAFTQAPAATVAAVVNDVGAEKNTAASVKTPASETTVTPAANHPTDMAPQTIEIIHVVVKGDTLWDIAKHYVNNPFRYPELARLSKIRNPDLIYPGNRVRIIKRQRQP